jgi:HD-GYP domain-containing protein (c-di-GMP phosphodiesterase class II)
MALTKFREIGGQSHAQADVSKLAVGSRLPFDVFVKDRGILKPLFNKGMIVTNFAKDILKEKGVSEIYIENKDAAALENYLTKSKEQKTTTSDDESRFKQYSSYKEEYHQIDKTLLAPGTKINFSLLAINKFSIHTIARASGDSPAVVDEKALSIAADIVIKKSDIHLYHEYLDSLLKDKNISSEEMSRVKAVAIRENSKIIMKDLLENPRSGEAIKKSNILVNSMIDCIMKNRDSIYNLLSIRNYDYYTYTHSVNVAVMAVGLGIAIDLTIDAVEKLGMGAMLHDIGKSGIPHDVLNKQGKLTDIEFRLMRNHVIEGEKILNMHKEIPQEAYPAVLQHHEKLSGKGYPLKLSGDEIKLFGRITAIADCYDALTTQRPYKPAFTPFYALSVVAKETGDYDPELLKAFIKMLGKIK